MEQTGQNPVLNNDKEQTASYGKFNSQEELLKAYNSLEAEFTKRSQKLKQIEAAATGGKDEWTEKVNTLIEKYPVAAELTAEIGEEIAASNTINDSNCLEKALLAVLSQKYKAPSEQAKDDAVIGEVLKNDTVKEKIIEEYRSKFAHSLPKTLPKGGEIPAVPPIKPKNMYEASKAALEILKEL